MCKPSHHHHTSTPSCGKFRLTHLFLGALLVMVLWNAVMPDLFNWPTLGYWQALGLLALSRLLIGGIGYTMSSGHTGSTQGRWRKALEAKMQAHCEQKRKEQDAKATETKKKRDEDQFREGFAGKQWDVNIIEVEGEDDPPAQDDADVDDNTSDRPSGK